MTIRSLRNIVFLSIICSTYVTIVSSQDTTDVSTTGLPDQTTTPTDTTLTDAASPNNSTTPPSTDSEQQTTAEVTADPTQNATDPSDGTTAPVGAGETTAGQSGASTTSPADGTTGSTDNSTDQPTTAQTTLSPATDTITDGAGNDTQSTETTTPAQTNDTQTTTPAQTNDTQTTTPAQTNDTQTTGSPGASPPATDNSSSTLAPDASTTSAGGTDTSTASGSSAPASPSESTAPPTPGPTTQSPATTEYPPVDADTDIATFTLQLKFNTPEVSCNGSYLRDELDKSLQSTTGYRGVKTVDETQVDASYSAKSLVESDSNSVQTELTDALDVPSNCYTFNETGLDDVISEFAAQSRKYCSARYLCPLGFSCREGAGGPVCVSVCEGAACQNEGQCDVVINKQKATAEAQCRCVDTIGTVYSGEKCEVSRMNPERIAAIVGGVLGAVCLILLVALYCTCYRKRENSGKKYHLSGVYNETYDHASLDMKNM